MPELPEVETVLRGISPILEGNQIDYAQVNRPDLRRPFPNNLAKRLKNRKINFLHRRSKYILIDLSEGETLIIALRDVRSNYDLANAAAIFIIIRYTAKSMTTLFYI